MGNLLRAVTSCARGLRKGIAARYYLAGTLALLLAGSAAAQFTLTPMPQFQAWDNTGRPCSGCLLYSYQAGTTTPQATFTDSTGGTPNSNPVVLNSAGRANVWLSTAAYKLVLKTAGGSTIYTVDNILSSVTSLLSTNNTWSGTQIFNGAITINAAATFNAGLTSSGPNTLNGGGTLSGSWLGSPTFSGTPNFSNGFAATTGTFSGQITSTVSTGTAPFVIASTTQVNNLNAGLLNGCTWASPCAIGTTTPNSATFTTLVESGGLTLTGAVSGANYVGNSGKVQGAGTNSGVLGAALCNDANSNATTTCSFGYSKIQAVKKTSSTCSPATSNSYDACTDTLTWPSAFADANYVVSCTGVQPNASGLGSGSNLAPMLVISSYNAATVTVITQQERSITSNFTEIMCIGVHP